VFGPVVDDDEADPLVAHDRGDLQVGRRGGEDAGGVVVDHHVAAGGGHHDGCHGVAVAAGERFDVDDPARAVGAAEKEDLIAGGVGNGLAHG